MCSDKSVKRQHCWRTNGLYFLLVGLYMTMQMTVFLQDLMQTYNKQNINLSDIF